jgi:hypothetical protein
MEVIAVDAPELEAAWHALVRDAPLKDDKRAWASLRRSQG